eukprot:Sdes_comp20888_c0_seq3m17993
MPPIFIASSQWKKQTWKNGGGITFEVLKDVQSIPWKFRVSVALVSSSGPFSSFDQIDRQIMLLEGKGFQLSFVPSTSQPQNVPDSTVMLSEPHRPFCFRGEDKIVCTLLDGACMDFNLMVHRDFCEGVLKVLTLEEGATFDFQLNEKMDGIMIFVLEGEMHFQDTFLQYKDSFFLQNDFKSFTSIFPSRCKFAFITLLKK